MKRLENPCRRDCGMRSATCHAECEAYKQFAEAERAANKAEAEAKFQFENRMNVGYWKNRTNTVMRQKAGR